MNTNRLSIRKGDRVRITVPTSPGHSFGAGWGEGIVLSADNWSRNGVDNWYIEIEKDKVGGRNWRIGYGYWKQEDGGTVELLEKVGE